MNSRQTAISPPSKVYLPALDTLRGVAIVGVLVHNLSIFVATRTVFDKLWNAFVESGWVGVQLFFVLSGFLITGILLDDRGKPRAIRAFYIRRFLRIFPLYYAFLILYFLVLPPFFPVLQRPVSVALWYWLYLSNWSCLAYGLLPGLGHLWSLAVEEQFYIVWPWIAVCTRRATLAWICIGIVAGSLAARGVLHGLRFSDYWLYASTICRADALAMGALVALAIRSEVWRPRLARALGPLGVFATIALVALMALTHGMNRNNPLIQIWGYSIIGIGGAVLVAMAARPDSPWWFDNRPLRFFGKYSYGMYMVHAPMKPALLYFFGPTLEPMLEARPIATDIAFIAAVTLATLGIALLLWSGVEKPLLRLKHHLAPR